MRTSPAAARLAGSADPEPLATAGPPRYAVRHADRTDAVDDPRPLAADRLLSDRTGVPGHARAPPRPPRGPVRPLAPRGRRPARGAGHRPGSGPTRPRRSTRSATVGSVVVATGTASGKSLCYQLPIVDAVRRAATPTPRCSCSRPRRSPRTSSGRCGRGSSPALRRRDLRRRHRRPTTGPGPASTPNVVLTNPEMLHQGILPSHERWATFLMRLRLRRRRRAAHAARDLRQPRRARAAPAPARLRALRLDARRSASRARRSATRPSSRRAVRAARSTAIDDDGSPQAERVLRALAAAAARRAHRRARRRPTSRPPSSLARFVRRRPPDARVHPQPARRRARGGAGHARRRSRAGAPRAGRPRRGLPRRLPARGAARARARLGDGALLGVAATNALELGIDVGGLDAVVLNGFPGTLASLRQQAGRAGRTGPARRGRARRRRRPARPVVRRATRPSCSAATPEAAVVNPSNPFVLDRRSRAPRTSSRSQPSDERVVRSRPRRRGARARARRAAQAARRQDVLGRPRAAGAAGRAAHRIVASSSGSSAGRRRDERLIGTVDSTPRLPRRAPRRAVPAPGPAVAGRAARPRRPRRRGSTRPTTPTSTPRPARTPTSRSSARTQRRACGAGVGPTSARST